MFISVYKGNSQNGQRVKSVCVCVSVIQAHAELCENLVQSHQKALMELQENSSKMIHQHAEMTQHLREVARCIMMRHDLSQYSCDNTVYHLKCVVWCVFYRRLRWLVLRCSMFPLSHLQGSHTLKRTGNQSV